MFTNTKNRHVRKFSRKPQSKFVASRRSQQLKRREEIETKYTDERFVMTPFTETETTETTETTEIEKIMYEPTNWIDDCIAELEDMFPEICDDDYIVNEPFEEENYINFYANIIVNY
jgi:hypothetical protein